MTGRCIACGAHAARAARVSCARVATFAAFALSVLIGLGGCASIRSMLPGADKADAPSAAASAASAAAARERADYQFQVDAPNGLDKLLMSYLDLARFQTAPAAESVTGTELERLRRAAPAQAKSLLETEGYFNADVAVERGQTGDGKALLRMVVKPGAQARVRSVDIQASGELERARNAGGEANNNNPAQREFDRLREQWSLRVGQPFKQSDWNAAKVAALARLRADGYPGAAWAETRAGIDAAQNAVTLELRVDSGPLYRLGEIRVEGLQRYDADAVRKVATFSPGTPYNEQLLLDFQERIQKIGLFQGAAVELDASPATSAAAPVLVRVTEQPLQQAAFGIGYSANTGERLSVEHYHRQPFGWRWIARSKAEYGPDNKLLSTEWNSYPLDNLWRNQASGQLESLRGTEDLRNSWGLRAGRAKDETRYGRLFYAELAHAQVQSSTYNQSGDALSANYSWIFRGVDDVLLPVRGLTINAEGALGYARGTLTTFATGDTENARGPFSRLYTRLTWYRPFGDKWFATVRGEAGQVFTRNIIGVPDNYLFRAGGDNSVRGYGFRSLGPTVDGAVGSGRSLFTASAEIAHPILAAYPDFLWATFVDAGNAADSWASLKPVFGYGAGVRWRSPVGPLKLDLAYGQDVQQFRVHLTVGVVF